MTRRHAHFIPGWDVGDPELAGKAVRRERAAITVPKLGAHAHQQAQIVGRQIAKAVGRMSAEEADTPFEPEIICMGDMGHNKAFYIHSNVWYGGYVSVFKMGYMYYALKLAFKENYYMTGGKPPTWGIPLTEVLAEGLNR